MRSRRFLVLAVVLAALNAVLWLAPAGLALRQDVINQLFGPRMIRAEVVVQAGRGATQDYRLDRGAITAVSGSSLTLTEADGTQQVIPLTAATQVVGIGHRLGLAALRRGLLVLIVHQANAPAESVQIEGRAGGQGIRTPVP